MIKKIILTFISITIVVGICRLEPTYAISSKEVAKAVKQLTYVNEDKIEDSLKKIKGGYEYKTKLYTVKAQAIKVNIDNGTSRTKVASKLQKGFTYLKKCNVNWKKVAKNLAIGATIIVVVYFASPYFNSTYYVFPTAAKCLTSGLECGAISVAINNVVCIVKNDYDMQTVVKQSIEGFSDGFKWGVATEGAVSLLKNITKVKTLEFSNGEIGKIKYDGSVVDEAGNIIGQAYNKGKNIVVLDDIVENATSIIGEFSSKGLEITSSIGEGISTVKAFILGESASKIVEGTASEYIDDAGEVYRNSDGLLANVEYKLNNYEYKTDSKGRISEVIAKKLKLSTTDREIITDSLEDIASNAKPTDERGHYIADMFGGSSDLGNLTAMDETVNKSSYKKVENTLKAALEKGKKVSLIIKPIYKGASERAKEFYIEYTIKDSNIITGLFNKAVSKSLTIPNMA